MQASKIRLDNVAEIMEERGINEDDIRAVIAAAEESGEKLVDGARSLAKKRLDNVTVYVEYTSEDDGFDVADVYSHRVALKEDEEN